VWTQNTRRRDGLRREGGGEEVVGWAAIGEEGVGWAALEEDRGQVEELADQLGEAGVQAPDPGYRTGGFS
jgi:hypothetical protein